MIQHKCTKCGSSYQDEDVEAYLCAPCIAERKAIAAQVDAQMASRPRTQPKSELQAYDEAPKVHGFMRA